MELLLWFYNCYISFWYNSSSTPLLKDCAFINGHWIDSADTFDVINPYDGKVIGHVPNLGAVECEDAIDAAYEV